MKPVYSVVKMVEPEWENVEAVSLTHTGWLKPCGVAARAQVCHNGEVLWVRLSAEEKTIRATLTGMLDSVCKDSCLEFFFAPQRNDKRYFNFEFNPLGTMFLGFGGERETRVRQIPLHAEQLFAPEPLVYESGWEIVFRIPLTFVQMYFPESSFSGEWRCNFYKCGELTENPHYLAWAPLNTNMPDYHRRQDFGILRFE